jgi:hypothetical protein
MVSDFAILQESRRGFTLESLQKKIKQEGQKKYLARLHQVTNAKEKEKLKQNEEEDADTEDLNKKTAINQEFMQQCMLVKDLLNLTTMMAREHAPQVVAVLAQINFERLLRKSMLCSENQFISKILGDKLVDLVYAEEDCFLALKSNGEIKRRLVLSLFALVKEEH